MSEKSKTRLPSTPWGCLPPQMRVLFVAGSQRRGGWLAEALEADSAMDVDLLEVVGAAKGLALLRDESFDAVLVGHQPQDLDALELIDAVRAGSSAIQPVIILGTESELKMTALCYEAGADAYLCLGNATTRSLIWNLARAFERHQLITENRRLTESQRHRLELEHNEATRLLMQQRSLIQNLEQIRRSSRMNHCHVPTPSGNASATQSLDLPSELTEHYSELLRTYVIMGSGSLADEMNQLSELLISSHISAQQAMRLHVQVLEELVMDLGSRSARHVMNRADLLILEVMVHLVEGYRRRASQRPYHASENLPGIELDRASAG